MAEARLCALAKGRNNNLNLIRMVAASAVLVSHAFPIALGPGTPEPLEDLLGRSLGSVAVLIFFAISGFLITRSYSGDRNDSNKNDSDRNPVAHWAKSRFLRLFPGLFVVLALTVLVLGPAVTSLPLRGYAADRDTLTYLPRNLSLAFLQYDLPGVFAANPYGGAINGSLWSLVHEVACYIGVLIAGLTGLLRSKSAAQIAVAVYAAAFVLTAPALFGDLLPGRAQVFRDLSLPFLLGAVAHIWRDKVILSWWPVALGAALLLALRPTPFFDAAFAAWVTYTVLCLAYLPGGAIRSYNRLGDYSYGIYIYAFPCQQLMVHLFGPMEPLTNMALAAPATLVCAVLSWHFVEGPALRLAHKSPPARSAAAPPLRGVPAEDHRG